MERSTQSPPDQPFHQGTEQELPPHREQPCSYELGFTKPGIYRVVFHMRGKDSKGKEINEPLDVVFLVGNDAFAKAKDLKEKGYPCIKGPVDGGDGGTTDTDPDGGDGSTDTATGSGDGTSGDGSEDSTAGDSESDGDQPADASGDEALGGADGGSGESGSTAGEGEDGSRSLLASTGVASIGVIATLMAGLFAMLVGAGVMMNRQTQQLVARHKERMLRNRKGRF